jgi:translation initiation factor IF-3
VERAAERQAEVDAERAEQRERAAAAASAPKVDRPRRRSENLDEL